jgi:hypothetical protein
MKSESRIEMSQGSTDEFRRRYPSVLVSRPNSKGNGRS